MKRSAYRPRRRLRDELLALSLAILCPVAMGLTLWLTVESAPVRAVREGECVRATCGFIALTSDAERRAVALTRSSGRDEVRAEAFERPNLFEDLMPHAKPKGVMRLADRAGVDRSPVLPDDAEGALPPSLAAPPAVALPPSPAEPGTRPAFSREELLALDERVEENVFCNLLKGKTR